MDIEAYVNHLRVAAAQQDKIILEVIEQQQHTILDLNISQLMGGYNSAGEVFGTYRPGPYRDLKERLNPAAGGNVDTRLTGAFHNSFYIEADAFPIYVRARDYKEPRLTERYGEEIFGLTQENKKEAAEELKPWIVEAIRTRVFLIR